jgi:hypothetical protein
MLIEIRPLKDRVLILKFNKMILSMKQYFHNIVY